MTLVPERRAQLRRLADELGVALGATGTHPWSPWQEQRIIDTPHYRLRDELLRYVVWRNNSFGLHVHVAIRGADRAVKVADGLRTYLPELLAWSASSPFVENVNTGLHSARTEIFTRFFPRCGIPDAYGDWDTFADYVGCSTRPARSPIRPRCGGASARTSAFRRSRSASRDAQPIQEESISLAALSYSLAARIARAVDEGEPLLVPANREIEENFWRAIRWGLSGEHDRPAHATRCGRRGRRSRSCSSGCSPSPPSSARREYLTVPDANAAERQIARFEEGASLEEIYAEQVRHSMEPVSG